VGGDGASTTSVSSSTPGGRAVGGGVAV
jgi:hypothetical protein